MGPLGPSLATAAGAPAPCDATSSRMGGSWRVQALSCWRCSQAAPRRRRQRLQSPRAALLDPPPFDPSKLRVEYLPDGRQPQLAAGRRYTLTHNDVTGSLQLSIGREYNRRQLDGWYTRMLRDEILAEWQYTAAPAGGPGAAQRPSLHVYCHVSGEELWPAPPQLRSFIFQREMALVLDTILCAEAAALAAAPALLAAPVYVHLASDIPALDRVVEWGLLGDRASWRTAQSSVMRSLMSSVLGTIDEADATDGSNGTWSRASFSAGSAWDGGAGANEPGAGPASAARASGSWDAGDGLEGGGGGGEEQQGAAAASEDAAGGGGGGGALGAAANGAVSLASSQQAAPECGSSWLGATAVVADHGRRRLPADVVPAAISNRQR